MNLKEFQERYGIRRIDFDKVKSVDLEEKYASDKMVCPYCGQENEYEAENSDEILQGTPWICSNCGKWFYAEGEITIDTTCTPIENKVLERFTRSCIENSYSHMDECDKGGCEWDNPFGVVEWETYKNYAEPLFRNMKMQEREE